MSKRICHITTVHVAKDTRIFQKECVSLAQNGFEVHLIIANQNVENEKGVQFHNIISTTSNRFQRMRKTTRLALKKALEIDADLYHFHDPELLPVGIKLKKRGKKVIYDTHEDVPRQILSKYYLPSFIRPIVAGVFEWYENRIAKKLDAIVAATPAIRDRFLAKNPNTVDINNFPILEKFSVPPSEKKVHDICYVGLISKIRGIEELVKSLEFTNAKLTLIGNFQSKEEEKKVRALPTWEKVNYLGKRNRTEVAKILSESKMGVVTFYPEPNHIEAQPNKLFEYMAAGLPSIVSDFPLWREIIEENNCGICVDPQNPKAIGMAVNTLLENPDKCLEMGKNGKQAVTEKYNWKKQEEKLIQLYHKILSKEN